QGDASRASEEASGPRWWSGRRFHLFVNTFVDEVGSLIEIFVGAALFGSHPAFPSGTRTRHRRGVLNGVWWPGSLNRWRVGVRFDRDCRRRAGAIGLASGKREDTGGEKCDARGEGSDVANHKLHMCIPEIPGWCGRVFACKDPSAQRPRDEPSQSRVWAQTAAQ